MMWAADSLPSDAWRFCHGGTVSASDCPLYASRIGTRYGGNPSNPGLPDMRGLFVRGSGRGSHLTNPNVNGNDQFGKPRLGVGCTGGYVGEVQKQQMSYHKHAGGFGEHDDSGAFGNTRRSNFVGTRKGLDWDNRSYFTNDGYEIDPESQRNSKYTLNRPELIGNETRPWNISLNYIIKVKE
ncbi:tail fiber protein [Enterococcus faecalis]